MSTKPTKKPKPAAKVSKKAAVPVAPTAPRRTRRPSADALDLILGVNMFERVVVARRSRVVDYLKLHDALTSTTWGQLKDEAPPWAYKEATKIFAEHNERAAPEPELPFMPEDQLPPFNDNDWPVPLDAEMPDLPADLAAAFGSDGYDALRNSWVEISPDSIDELTAELSQRGYSVERNDQAILAAYGQGKLDPAAMQALTAPLVKRA
jgi:hypothetical protein